MSEARILVNGEPLSSVAATDRGLMYGDGVFRTLRLRAGRPLWWQAQLDKLADDCARLGLPCPDPEVWRADLARLAPGEADAVLKWVVTRGPGARGYRPPAAPAVTRLSLLSPAPPVVTCDAVRARVCRLRLGHQPILAGVKHLNRLENVLARAEWEDPEIAEGLLLDQDGHLVSGTHSNVFLARGGRLHTPALRRCGVAGVARARLLDSARDLGIEVVLDDGLWLDDVLAADEVLLCNSLIGLWRVGRLDAREWSEPVFYPTLKERLDALDAS
jgi:4-amino-4-deoxychorismate lyase